MLSDLCVRSKAVWGYDEWFMAQAREALQVSVEEIAAGDVWVATAADGSVAGVVALAFSDCNHFTLLRLLFCRVRDIETALHGLTFFDPFNYNAVV